MGITFLKLCVVWVSLLYNLKAKNPNPVILNPCPSFFFFNKDLFIFIYECIVAVFRHTRRRHQIPSQMVVSHHMVVGIGLGTSEEQPVLLTAEPSHQPPAQILICI